MCTEKRLDTDAPCTESSTKINRLVQHQMDSTIKEVNTIIRQFQSTVKKPIGSISSQSSRKCAQSADLAHEAVERSVHPDPMGLQTLSKPSKLQMILWPGRTRLTERAIRKESLSHIDRTAFDQPIRDTVEHFRPGFDATAEADDAL